ETNGRPGEAQIAILSMSGGEAWSITNLPKSAGAPWWSPDGTRLVFTSTTSPEDLARQRRGSGERAGGPERGSGQSEEQQPSLPAEQREQGGERSRTPGEEHISDVRVITRAVYRFNGPGYLDPTHPSHIWIVTVPAVVTVPASMQETTTPKALTAGKYAESDPVWSKDGSQIYFTSTHVDEPYYELPTTDIYVMPAGGGEAQKLIAIPFQAGAMSLSPD